MNPSPSLHRAPWRLRGILNCHRLLICAAVVLMTIPRPAAGGSYDGRAPDAPWRTEAAARIEQLRKGNYLVQLNTLGGVPIGGARIRVRLIKHAFHFGAGLEAGRIVPQSDPAKLAYLEHLATWFNTGNFDHDLDWTRWATTSGSDDLAAQARIRQAVAVLQARNLPLQGGPLVSPFTELIPAAFQPLLATGDAAFLRQIDSHISNVMQALPNPTLSRGWTVLEAPSGCGNLTQTYGDAVLIDWFRRARSYDAQADLFISERNILSNDGNLEARQNAYESVIRYIREGGGPLTGIGFEGHFDENPTGIPQLRGILQRFAAAFPDTSLRITDFDIATTDEALQADYTRDLLTLAFSQPNMRGVQLAGSWAPQPEATSTALFRSDWTAKPNALAYRDLVEGEWSTDDEDITCECGHTLGRGFLGTYAYEITLGDHRLTGVFELPKEGVTVTRTLDVPVEHAPRIVQQPLGRTLVPGETALFTTTAAGQPVPRVIWYHNGVSVGRVDPDLLITRATPAQAGTYYAIATNDYGSAQTRSITIAVQQNDGPTGWLSNLSTRGPVGPDTGPLIVGFVIAGGDQDVLLRGVGRELEFHGIAQALADPRLSLFRHGDTEPWMKNDDWAPALAPDFARLGAFALTEDPKSAALQTALAPGVYTVHLAGPPAARGVALAEIYDFARTGPAHLVNLSARGHVGTGEKGLVAGFVVEGSAPQRVLIRGIGPGLRDLGVTDAVADPFLRLNDFYPDRTPRALHTNDDWTTGGFRAMNAAELSVGAFPLPTRSADAAMAVWLEPGVYTVELSDAQGGTGSGLIEVYLLP